MSPDRLELTPHPPPPLVAPNHPRGLYYKGLAAHLTPQRRRGAGRETGTSAPLSFHMVEHHTQHWRVRAHTHTQAHTQVAWVPQQLCVAHQIADRAPDLMSVCRRETDKKKKKSEVTVAVAFTYSTNHPNPLYVCYMVMLMSSSQDLSLGLTPKEQWRAPGCSRQGSAEEALAVPLLLTEQPFLIQP